MLRDILRKEILENIQSLRFVLSLLLIVSVFITSGLAFVSKYRQEVQDYRNGTNRNASGLSEHAGNLIELAFYRQTIWRSPKVLELCAEGFEKSLPNRFDANVFTIEYPEVRSRSNFMLPRFSDADWTFVISFILSFVALLLTYDSICGEKESGTLSMMLSKPIPRDKVLLGKYVGAMLALGIPLLLGLLMNLLIVSFSDEVVIRAGEWLKILAIVLLSFLYLSVFLLLGMLVSSRTRRSSSSMVILLLLWVGLVILIPSFGRIVSEKLHAIPNRSEVNQEIADAKEQIWEHPEKYGKNASSWSTDLDPEKVNPPARARLFDALTDARNRIFDGYITRMIAQADVGRRFTRVSPTVLYQSASEAFGGTGIARFRHLYQQIKRYQRVLKQFVLEKDQEDPESGHLLWEDKDDSKLFFSTKPVDFSTVPQFQERDPSLAESLQWAIWDVGLLILFNVLFFVGAYVSCLRYDARYIS